MKRLTILPRPRLQRPMSKPRRLTMRPQLQLLRHSMMMPRLMARRQMSGIRSAALRRIRMERQLALHPMMATVDGTMLAQSAALVWLQPPFYDLLMNLPLPFAVEYRTEWTFKTKKHITRRGGVGRDGAQRCHNARPEHRAPTAHLHRWPSKRSRPGPGSFGRGSVACRPTGSRYRATTSTCSTARM